MDAHKKIREHISALSDGELSTSDLELASAALRSADGELAWLAYHRIGDVLRGQQAPEFSPGFNARLAARLAGEPVPQRRAAAGSQLNSPLDSQRNSQLDSQRNSQLDSQRNSQSASLPAVQPGVSPSTQVGSSLSADGAASVVSTTS
ncbi:sigma-E factor negative regulatory protein [Massilia sp. PWRC2]|uniref:sigma-E factor negative regulatory protein n=1 Tax=Massilia sp. PWRC2 TaxID=2804626 RepID=UPI003CF5CED4